MMKNKKIILSVVLILVIATTCICLFTGCKTIDKAKDKISEVTNNINAINGDGILDFVDAEELGITLKMGAIEVHNADTNEIATASDTNVYVSQNISATLTPESLNDKYVTWSVKWADNAALKSSNVSEYVQIPASSQGALTATLNCYKSFKGSNIILDCVARQGGKKATVTVTYKGLPSSLTVSAPSGVTKYNLGNKSVDSLLATTTYTYDINFDNVFHDVDNSLGNLSVSVQGIGAFTAGTYSASSRGAGWSSHSDTVVLEDIKNDLISVTITNRKLVITSKRSYLSYYESMKSENVEGNGLTKTYTKKFYETKKDSDGNDPFFRIKISCDLQEYGKGRFETTFDCFIAENVESISFSQNTIIF